MATATKSKQSDSPESDAGAYVDFDEFIDFQIAKTCSGIKATDLLTALIGGSAAVLAYLLVFAVFDHWIIDGGFGRGSRLLFLSILVLGLIGWAVWKLVLPYFKRVTDLYAAKQIEETAPICRTRCSRWSTSNQTVDPSPDHIAMALEKRSARNLSEMDVEQAVDRRLLMRLSYVLFALVVLMCGYVLFSPKKLSNSLWRALLPTSNVAVDTRTRIDAVDPGDTEVLARAQLDVSADISGAEPESVTLLYTTADRRFVNEPVTMRLTEEGLRRYTGRITGENGRGILQNLRYYVQAGDASSDTYRVVAKQPPSAKVNSVDYEYPDYMGLASRTQPAGSIDAHEGTWITVRATANMPVQSAIVLFSDTEDTTQKAEEITATVENGTQISARWRLRIPTDDSRLRDDDSYAGFYRLQVRNDAGENDPEPALHSILIRPDQRPEIALAQPTADIERPANAIVPLLYAAEDPDFLLRSVILHLELNGEELPQKPRLYQAPPFRKSLQGTHRLELDSLSLKSGDRVTYWLEARDNMEPFADRSGNRTNSPKLNIAIIEPAPPEQVQQQLEEDQQQIADRLEEVRQQDNDASLDPPPGDQEMSDDTEPPVPNTDQPQQSEPQQNQPTSDATQQGQSAPNGQPQDSGPGRDPSGADQQGQSGDGQAGESLPGQQGKSSGETGDSAQDGAGQSQQPPGSEPTFDELLERMIQEEQKRQQSEQSGQNGQPQQSSQQPNSDPNNSDPNNSNPNKGQQPQDGTQPTGEKQPGPNPSGESSSNPNDGRPHGDSTSEEMTGSDSSGSQPQQSPSAGSESTSPSNSQQPKTDTGENSTTGGEDESISENSTGSGDPSATDQPTAGERTTGQPSDGDLESNSPTANNTGTPPAGDPSMNENAENSESHPNAESVGGEGTEDGVQDNAKPQQSDTADQPRPESGPPNDRPADQQGGQPDGPDQPMQGEGDSHGQRSDQPQTGEGGNSQQTSQGNPGSEQQGAGDSTGKPGQQQASDRATGQSGSQQSGQGSQSKSGGDKPGGSQQSSGDQPGGGQQGENQQSGNDQSMSAEDADQSGGESPSGDASKQESSGGTGASATGSNEKSETGESPPSPGTQSEPQDGDEPSETRDGSSESSSQEGGKPQGMDGSEGSQQSSQQGGGEKGGQEGGEQGGGDQGSGQQGRSQQAGGDGQQAGGQNGGGQGASGEMRDVINQENEQRPEGKAQQGPAQSGDNTLPQGGGSGDGEGQLGEPGDKSGAGDGTPPTPRGDDPDLAAKKKAANLVLKRLREQIQRGQIDGELQQDLGVTPDQLRRFTQKLEQRLAETGAEDLSPEADARRRQFEETLRTIDFDSKGTTREGGDGPRESAGGFSGPNRSAPVSRRDQVRAYRERLLQKNRRRGQ